MTSRNLIRGSRKHVLDWTSSPDFCDEFVQIVRPVEVRLNSTSHWMPRGYDDDREARLKTFGPTNFPEQHIWDELRAWWLVRERGANTPNWDIALSCEVNDRPGLVLVEAKANVPELGRSGKPLVTTASEASQKNHDRIGEAINEACVALRHFEAGTNISRDSHYQLANRLAFGWKLASLGIPTVIAYLGFCGDNGIVDVGEPFKDPDHWTLEFARYAHSVAPKGLFEREIKCGDASVWFIVRSRCVVEPSMGATASNESA